MKTPLDNDLNKAYEAFNQNHNHLRQTLMASLPDRSKQHKRAGRVNHALAFIRGTIMKSRITKLAAAATVIIVAVMIGISQFGGPIDGASVAWADVIETLENDIKSTNTIHILMTLRMTFSTVTPRLGENGEVESEEPHIVRGECWLRRNPFAGKSVLEGVQTNYFTEKKWVGLEHHGKKWFEQSIPKEKRNVYGMFDALVTGDFEAHQEIPGFSISDGQVVGSEIIVGEKATIYEFIGTPSEEKKEEGHPPIYFKCWVRDSDHKTVRMQTHYGDSNKFNMDYELIEYDVTIPPGTLEVKIPEGYTKHLTVEERIRATVPTNVIELKQAYDKARDAFPNYRMIILDNNGNIKRRVAKEDEKWRLDNYGYRRKSDNAIDVSQMQDFDDLWNQTEALKGKIEVTLMPYKRNMGQIIWHREDLGNSPTSRLLRYRAINEQLNSLEHIAWRTMYINAKDAKIQMLPRSEKFPGCMGVSISSQIKGFKKTGFPPTEALVIFWIDPSKDYICIRHEHHQRPKAVWEEDNEWEQHEPETNTHDGNGSFHSEIVEITKLAQTPDGKWFPAEIKIQHHSINRDGTRVSPSRKATTKSIYVDTQGLIDPNLFDWPEELLLPTK
ncbi:MAG TPA: hypothetical protein HPP66_04325 [Planctomycetes bacterium]|nr:hypothetical protein [Planctomycetota bacterium]